VFVCAAGVHSSVYGATDDFTISTLIGSDTEVPTTPSGLVAIPVAVSQIDLEWGSSTDDFILSGYHVWRDGVQIATTSVGVEMYSDTGLTASTTYTYYVTAFDSFMNESASSTEVSTTTLDNIPPPPPPSVDDDSHAGTRIVPLADMLESLVVLPGKESALIRFKTNGYFRGVIKWGRSISYEIGSSAENAYAKFHDMKVSELTPGTTYYFTIEGEARGRKYGTIYNGSFTTLPADDVFSPGNVTNLRAVREGNDVVLTWTNPTDTDLEKVRIIRSDSFFPGDIADGYFVYEGIDERVRDTDVGRTEGHKYYTVFSYDALGNISSGAVVRIHISNGGEPVGDTLPLDTQKNEINLSLDSVHFLQDGTRIAVEDGKIQIDGTQQFTISIPYGALPEHLKTILVVMREGADSTKTFSFLLRVNADKSAFESTVAPLGVSGIFPVQISVFDFKTAQIGYTEGVIESAVTSLPMPAEKKNLFLMLLGQPATYAILLLALVLFLFLVRRSTRDEEI
jgi:hypothetical protein